MIFVALLLILSPYTQVMVTSDVNGNYADLNCNGEWKGMNIQNGYYKTTYTKEQCPTGSTVKAILHGTGDYSLGQCTVDKYGRCYINMRLKR